jgi:hypothetical protein
VQLQLRNDVFFSPSAEGVSFSGFGRDGQLDRFTLKGKMLYPIMEQLYPRLNGQHETQAIINALPFLQRKLGGQMLEILSNRGFIYERPVPTHNLSQVELELYASQLNFIGCYSTDPEARFEKFRRAQVLLVGGGWTAVFTAQGLWENGLGRLDWQPLNADATIEAAIANQFETAQAYDAGLVFKVLPLPGQATPDWTTYDLVLFATDIFEEKYWLELERSCRASGRPTYPAVFGKGQGRLGPLMLPEYLGCWHCGSAGSDFVPDPSFTPDQLDPSFSPIAAALLGNTLAYRVFRFFSLFGGAESRSMFWFETASLEQHEKLAVWRPTCEFCRSGLSLSSEEETHE